MKVLTVKDLENLGYPENVKTEMIQVGGTYGKDSFYDPSFEINDSMLIATVEYIQELFLDYKELLEDTSPIFITETEMQIFINRYQSPKSIAQLANLFEVSQAKVRDAILKTRYAIYRTYEDITFPFPEYISDTSSVGKYIKGDISTYTFIRNPQIPVVVKLASVLLVQYGLLGNITNLSHPQAYRHIRPETLIRVENVNWTDLAVLEWVFKGELNRYWINLDRPTSPWDLKVKAKIWKSSHPPIIST